jgi:hypothetical protein
MRAAKIKLIIASRDAWCKQTVKCLQRMVVSAMHAPAQYETQAQQSALTNDPLQISISYPHHIKVLSRSILNLSASHAHAATPRRWKLVNKRKFPQAEYMLNLVLEYTHFSSHVLPSHVPSHQLEYKKLLFW